MRTVVVAVAWLAAMVPCLAGEVTLADIREALAAQEKAFSVLDVEIETRNMHKAGAEKKTTSGRLIRYARKGDKVLYHQVSMDADRNVGFEEIAVLAKGVSTIYQPHNRSVQILPVTIMEGDYGRTLGANNNYPVPSLIPCLGRFLPDALAADRARLMPDRMIVDGLPCRVVMGVIPSGFMENLAIGIGLKDLPERGSGYRIYVAESLGWMPVKIEFLHIENGTIRVWRLKEIQEYRLWNDGPGRYATRVKDTVYNRRGEVENESETMLQELKVGKDVPDDTFDLAFPPGTKVSDAVKGTNYTIQ